MKKFTEDFKKMNLNEGKNNKRNKNNKNKKEENKIQKEPEEPKELTEEEKFKEELINIRDKIRELKMIFDRNKPKKFNEDKIENYFLFEKVVNFDNLKQKIISAFNNEDIYSTLFNLWNKCIEYTKNKNNDKIEENQEENDSSEEDNDKRNRNNKRPLLFIFNKLLMNLNFFTPKIIVNTKDASFKEQICETIFNNIQLIKEIEDGQYFLYYFTEVFNIREIFINKLLKEQKEKMTEYILGFIVFGLNLINIFNLQEMFPIEKMFKIISDNYYLISYHIYSLLSQTYIKNSPDKKYLVLDNIFKLLQENKNVAQYNLVYELINGDFKTDTKKNEIIKKFMSLISINLERSINPHTLDNAIYYCKIIFENEELFEKDEIINAKKYICGYFNNLKEKDWKNNLSKLNKFEFKELKDFFDKKSLYEYYNNLPLTKIESFAKILKFIPEKINKFLNILGQKNSYNDGLKLIKMLKLTEDDIPLKYKEERMKLFFHYKIRTCEEENNPHTLIEYCLISQKTFDVSIYKILNKYYNCGNRYNYFYLYVINELYYEALNRSYLQKNKNLKREIEKIYYKLKYEDKYTFKDHFGPVTKDCITIDSQKTKVEFIDDIVKLEDALKKYFVNSEYVGIDSEWQQNFNVIDKSQVSIIQISNYEENCVILLDMLELSNIDKFYEIFETYFKNKIFIGFYFDKSDLEVFPPKLRNFFEDNNKCTIYDLTIIAQQKFLEKVHSLKLLTEKLFGKSLCKYEQCSNWNLRPLSQCQLHYGALDALICVMIYKKLIEG